jgi:D-inositol-3-phosphate glycosyltransferase
MKLAVIGPVHPYRGGISHFTTLLAQNLIARGHDVLTVSFKRQYPRFLYPGTSDKDPSLQPLQVGAEYILDPLYPWTWRRALRRIQAHQPALTVIQWWSTFWAPAYAYLARRLKTVYLIHNTLPHEPRFFDPFLAKLALGRGQAFIVQTQREGERLKRLLPHAQTTLCPHPVYDMLADQRIPPAEARQKLNLPPKEPVILFFGFVRAYKGLGILLQALAELKAAGKSFTLLIAGEFWEDEVACRKQIQELGLVEQVRIENRYIPNEEVPLFFSAADLFAAPYLEGTQSGAAKMALGFGLPLVLSEIIRDGSEPAGMVEVFPTGDFHALAETISRTLAKPHPIASNSSNGWDEMSAVIERLAGDEAE